MDSRARRIGTHAAVVALLIVGCRAGPLQRPIRLEAVIWDAAPAPDSPRLVLSYSRSIGSFGGRTTSLLLDAGGDSAAVVRPFACGLLHARWTPAGDAVYGFGRPSGTAFHGLYRATDPTVSPNAE